MSQLSRIAEASRRHPVVAWKMRPRRPLIDWRIIDSAADLVVPPEHASAAGAVGTAPEREVSTVVGWFPLLWAGFRPAHAHTHFVTAGRSETAPEQAPEQGRPAELLLVSFVIVACFAKLLDLLAEHLQFVLYALECFLGELGSGFIEHTICFFEPELDLIAKFLIEALFQLLCSS